MRDETLTADQKLDKLLELQKGKKRTRSTPTQRPYDEENPAPGPAPAQEEDRLVLREKAPKKPRAKAKATPAIKDSVAVEAKPKPKARASKNAPMLAIEGPEQPKALPPPAKSGPPKGKKPTIRVLPLTTTSVNKDGVLKPAPTKRGRPRKMLVEPEFA
jgi:hypothetical protein